MIIRPGKNNYDKHWDQFCDMQDWSPPEYTINGQIYQSKIYETEGKKTVNQSFIVEKNNKQILAFCGVKFLDKSKDNFIPRPITFKQDKNNITVEVAMIWNTSYYENMLCFTNNIRQIDGGTHLAGFRSSVTRVINKFVNQSGVFEKNKMRFQNLGNLGTPLGDLFDRTPKLFNVSSGFNSLDSYYKAIRNNKFYNTKSPFIDLELILGGKGRNKVDFLFFITIFISSCEVIIYIPK